MSRLTYALVTPAHNEEGFIEATLASVCAQTVLPVRWVIVDDGSDDGTARAAEAWAQKVEWIEVLRLPQRAERHFAGKARAFNAGYERLKPFAFDCIGSLDADVSFEPDYFEFLLDRMAGDERLGVVGSAMIEAGYDPLKESFFNENDVFGACQVFRRECFTAVGGYTPVRGGGIDWIAIRTARMKGWRTRCFLEKSFFHHRPMGATGTSIWRARFDYGQKDYYLGNHPVWQALRIGFQLTTRPYVIGGLLILAGYLHAGLTRMPRPLSGELLAFHRREQLDRLRCLVRKRLSASGIVRPAKT